MKLCGGWKHFAWAILLVAGLSACASGPAKPKPTALAPNPALLGVQKAWSNKIGTVDFALRVQASAERVTLASGDGTVLALDAVRGTELWRTRLDSGLSAGVGSDGRLSAVVTRNNDLVTLDAGREIWRSHLTTQVFTAPLVAGARVFVLGADRSLTAFDGNSGRQLWQNLRPGEALVLHQSGVLLALGNTLVAGLAGHLVGINPLNGNLLWDSTIANARGTNDIERLLDLVGGVSRQQDNVCVRAFQSTIACVDTQRASVSWRRAAQGSVGLAGDTSRVYGVEDDGRVMAWNRSDGQLSWSSDWLRYRQLSEPLVLGRSLVVGDASGFVHLLSRLDGSLLTRLSTDDSAISVAPVLAGGTLVVVTHSGGVYGFRPE